ncbi:hypothetical protein GKQ38_02600 [Candidatus Nanohaloarchaea archaeon]|nr:hypothetical protein GKQ38_02600 [Candidatus Nanohaloarchaea archaeon]
MSTKSKYSLDDVLTPQELQTLQTPDNIDERPDAEVVEWGDTSAVTTPGFSIASSIERFQGGNLSPAQESALRGFSNEFSEHGENVLFMDDELREVLGDEVVARVQGFEEAYVAKVLSPDQAMDIVERYDDQYLGDVVQRFGEEIDSNHAVLPAIYNDTGLIEERPVALMEGEGLMAGEDSIPVEKMLDEEEDDVGKVDPQSISMKRYPAPEDVEASFYLDVQLPAHYDEASYQVENNSIVIEADGQKELQSFATPPEIIEEDENNGVYSFEIK